MSSELGKSFFECDIAKAVDGSHGKDGSGPVKWPNAHFKLMQTVNSCNGGYGHENQALPSSRLAQV
jgi:hypothetical protein